MKKILMGIGNEQRLDDGVGIYIVRHVQSPEWQVLVCHTMPENFTGLIKQQQPEQVVLVDAADMNLAPGSIRIIPTEKLDDIGSGTHALPMTLLMNIMQPSVSKPIRFIGIQPEQVANGVGLSKTVLEAAHRCIALFDYHHTADLPIL